jgi:exodeoxyribonuclease V alpha subunit
MTPPSAGADRAVRAEGLLGAFNDAGVLHAGDVHLAVRLGHLFGETDPTVLLAMALAARAPRLGHVCIDLRDIAVTVSVDAEAVVDVAGLPWPGPSRWRRSIAASPLVGVPATPVPARPLIVDGHRLYLRRCYVDELAVAEVVAARAVADGPAVDSALLEAGLLRCFGPAPDPAQLAAARVAVTGRIAVICGGPGTGKTTTVAAVLALLCEQAEAAGAPGPRIAVSAPTGKAAERLGESIAVQTAALPIDDDVRATLAALEGVTLHRLLGIRPTGAAHDRDAPLPHDVVVVDEASMVSLALMARLVAALRDDARLILVGDAGQLASVEAGAVLGDIVGPAADGPAPSPLGGRIAVLRTVHRFGSEIGALAEAVRAGAADEVVEQLRRGDPSVTWIPAAGALRAGGVVADVVVDAGRRVFAAAAAGDAPAALAASGAVRVLCAHRRGPGGVAAWNATVESWLRGAIDGYAPYGEWYVGRPVLVTENDYATGLFNGDSGVVLAGGAGRVEVAFARAGGIATVSASRLGAAETVHAMTIHKSQGSQVATAVVVVPDTASQLLTRELLYTAITRAREHLILIGSEDAIRAAVRRPIARASGLRDRLWGAA